MSFVGIVELSQSLLIFESELLAIWRNGSGLRRNSVGRITWQDRRVQDVTLTANGISNASKTLSFGEWRTNDDGAPHLRECLSGQVERSMMSKIVLQLKAKSQA